MAYENDSAAIDPTKLLQGRYEADGMPAHFSPDSAVPDFGYNVLNRLGLLYRPVVDEQRLAAGRPKPAWPDEKPFAVCLTHDVDHLSARSARQSIRETLQANRARKRHRQASGWRILAGGAIRSTRHAVARGEDPLHCYERWLAVEELVGASSTFLFLPERPAGDHYTNPVYRFSDAVRFDGQRCTVAEMMREIDRRGWEIGLHATWYAFDDADALRREKDQIEQILGHQISTVRQHYLHYDIRTTPRAHSDAGFKYDSTLGFNDNVGFRFGTSHPFSLYDLGAEEYLPILEVPLIVQDTALLGQTKGLRLDGETAFRYAVQMTDRVERVGGVLTLLWHPDKLVLPGWLELYARLLEHLRARNAWFAPVRQLGEWWNGNAGVEASD